MTVDGSPSAPFPPRTAIPRILGIGASALFAETPLLAALRDGTPDKQLPLGVSHELELATLMALHDVAFTHAQLAWLQLPCAQIEQDQPLPLSNGLLALTYSRPELVEQIEPTIPAGRADLLSWWILQGRVEAAMQPMLPPDSYAEASHSIEQDQPLIITRGLHTLAQALPELRSSLALTSPAGRLELIRWWMLKGRLLPDFVDLVAPSAYAEASPLIEQDQPLIITRGLHALALSLPELQASVDTACPEGRRLLIQWWMSQGCYKASFEGLGGHEGWDTPSPVSPKAPMITRGLHALWISREDLQQAFDISDAKGRQGLAEWYQINGEGVLERPTNAPRRGSDSEHLCRPNNFRRSGLNILGYGRGEFGIGEDVRMAIAACEFVGVPACVPRLPLRVGARQHDLSAAKFETDTPSYNINLICLPFFETLRLLGKTREAILDCRYNIAFWQWELPRFPPSMACALDLVDEIWASSEFTASAMRAATEKPVFKMPMVVRLPEGLSQWSRAEFELPEDDFIFLTVLDGSSSLKRKNPLATVRAFSAAFPRARGVRLVVKAMNVSLSQPDWCKIVECAAKDERISLIVDTMTKDKLLGLQSVCDCFVSLHRSEGFGRNIAEAMLLGKPVIVSDYSGNKDFTTKETAFLVPGEVIPLSRGDYPYAEGQSWFEPDASIAAVLMRTCLENSHLRNSLAMSGRLLVQDVYSEQHVGSAYLARLVDKFDFF